MVSYITGQDFMGRKQRMTITESFIGIWHGGGSNYSFTGVGLTYRD